MAELPTLEAEIERLEGHMAAIADVVAQGSYHNRTTGGGGGTLPTTASGRGAGAQRGTPAGGKVAASNSDNGCAANGDERQVCRFAPGCYRTDNPAHMAQYRHPGQEAAELEHRRRQRVLLPDDATWELLEPQLLAIAGQPKTGTDTRTDAVGNARPSANDKPRSAGICSTRSLLSAMQQWCARVNSLDTLDGALASEDSRARFFEHTLPVIAQHAAQLRAVFPTQDDAPRIMPSGRAMELVLPQHSAAVLLASMFLCILPSRGQHDMPGKADFSHLLGRANPGKERRRASRVAKLQCYLHFFDRLGSSPRAEGNVVFTRHVAPELCTRIEFWRACAEPLRPMHATREGLIDDAPPDRFLHADFANAYIGGGVLSHGAVQEEIRFAVAPLCTVALMLFARMAPNESITLRGCETVCKWTGYSGSFRFAGDHQDASPRDDQGAVVTTITAIDAIPYTADPRAQYHWNHMLRDIVKAYAGFVVSADHTGIATGNWGCGAFNGDVRLKSMLQWLAASAAGKDIKYYTFGEGGDEFVAALEHVAEQATARGRTCADLVAALDTVAILCAGRSSQEICDADLIGLVADTLLRPSP